MLSPEAMKMLQSRAPNSDTNPFERDHATGAVTMRADKFEVTPRWIGNRFQGYFIRYFWRNMLVSVDKLDTDEKTTPCCLAGIELRHTIDIGGMGIHVKGRRRGGH